MFYDLYFLFWWLIVSNLAFCKISVKATSRDVTTLPEKSFSFFCFRIRVASRWWPDSRKRIHPSHCPEWRIQHQQNPTNRIFEFSIRPNNSWYIRLESSTKRTVQAWRKASPVSAGLKILTSCLNNILLSLSLTFATHQKFSLRVEFFNFRHPKSCYNTVL